MPIAIGVFAVIVLAVALRGADATAAARPSAPRAGTSTTRSRAAMRVLLRVTSAFLLYLTFTAEHRVDTVANHERPAVIDRRDRREVGVDVHLSGLRLQRAQRHGRAPAARRPGR